jgi:type II secretory pathway component PulM
MPNGDEPGRRDQPSGLAARKRTYLIMMGACVLLIVLAWTLIWRFSLTAAVAMSAAALVVPPVAAIVANSGPANRQ